MADPTALGIVRGGQPNLASWLQTKPAGFELDLSGEKLQSFIHPGFDFSKIKLNLSGATLESVDLSGADLSGANLSGVTMPSRSGLRGAKFQKTIFTKAVIRDSDLADTIFDGADCQASDFSRCQFNNSKFFRTDLSGARLVASDFTGARFESADLSKANLAGARFTNATFAQATLSGATGNDPTGSAGANGTDFDLSTWVGVTAIGADFPGSSFQGTTISGGSVSRSNLERAKCSNAIWIDIQIRDSQFSYAIMASGKYNQCDMTGTLFRWANLSGAELVRSRLCRVDLFRAGLSNSRLDEADVAGADFHEADINDSLWQDIQNLAGARNLPTTRIADGHDPKYVDTYAPPFFERWCSWEKIRTFGRLPLFGVSYAAVILIPTYIYFRAWYNTQAAAVRHRLGAVEAKADAAGLEETSEKIVALSTQVHDLPMPSWSLITFISCVLLAVASTLYAIWCPSRIREFTRDVWRDQLRKPLIHYLPFSWQRRWLRVTCMLCYVVGGGLAVIVLVRKLGSAGLYIWEHS